MKDVERAVRDRYSEAAGRKVEALCCPTQYDPKLLEAIPEEVLERDYGCGDPSRWLEPGDTVLDLGSGSGKICFIASQVVGPSGRVIGVDEAKKGLFREIHRVLRPGGRAVISDITSDETVPASMQEDPELWSGCISGAFREDRILRAFLEAGLSEPTVLERQEEPWKVVERGCC